MTIPKIIHYCWFGKKEKPELLKSCINSWTLLSDYSIVEWNESNYDVTSHCFTDKMYAAGKFAYVADYVRLKILYNFGGIYFDADVEVKKRFDDSFLQYGIFLPFSFDCALSTAIIGAEKGNGIIADLLRYYDSVDDDFHVNNTLITKFFLNHYSDFRLNNKFQVLGENIAVYPKEYFDCPSNDENMGYSVHHALGSWQDKTFYKNKYVNEVFVLVMRLIITILKFTFGEPLYAQYRRRYSARKTQFYDIYLQHNK